MRMISSTILLDAALEISELERNNKLEESSSLAKTVEFFEKHLLQEYFWKFGPTEFKVGLRARYKELLNCDNSKFVSFIEDHTKNLKCILTFERGDLKKANNLLLYLHQLCVSIELEELKKATLWYSVPVGEQFPLL